MSPAAEARPTLIVDTSFLGDVLCAEPLVRAAARNWPDAPLDFLASPGGAQMVQHHPELREILVFDKRNQDRGVVGLLRLARRLRKRGYARVICSHRSWRTAFLLRLARIPTRVGFDNASGSWLFTERVPYREDLHEIERNLQLVGGGRWEPPRVFPSFEEEERAARLTPAEAFVAVAPGSIWATKRWPEEHFAAVVEELGASGVSCVLLGGPDDTALCQRIAATGGDRVRDLCGRTTLRESYAVLQRAAVLLTNDSAPMHLGVAARVPVVAVYCSTLPGFGFQPMGARDLVLEVAELECRPCGIHGRRQCPEGHFRCGWETSPTQVLRAIRERLPRASHEA